MSDRPDVAALVARVSREADELKDLLRRGTAEQAEVRRRVEAIAEQLADLAAHVEPVDAVHDEVADLERRLAAMTDSRDRVSATLRRLQQRKSVRIALAAAEQAGALRDRVRSGPQRTIRPPHRSHRMVTRRIESLRPAPGSTSGPLVSIIVPTRDGAHHLRRLLPGLDRTSYRSFELIVVDNASEDGTSELLQQTWSFPVRVVANETNKTFSESCNLGARAAEGSLLLFLNNDVEPINAGWLGTMVDDLGRRPAASATGALLVYPAATHATALTVQHRGISFVWKDDGPRPVNLGGEPADDPGLTGTVEVAAATAACLLVRADAFDTVGGFTDAYVYGWEDVDLCMKLRSAGGSVLVSRDAALFHHEFGTQDLLGSETRRINYLNNSRAFGERWAGPVRRAYLRDRVGGGGMWARDGAGRVAITVTDLDKDAGYGDWYTAHELGDALTAEGWSVSYLQRKDDDWYDGDADVVIMLLPQLDVRRLPEGTFTVAWVRNWTSRWLENPSFDDVDLVVASTRAFADEIERATTHRVEVIPLATNPDRFRRTEPDSALVCDYTFTGSFWGTGREIERFLDVRPDETFTIYGKGWDRRPRGQRYWRGHLDYDRLPALYSSAALVLDDTVEPNRPAVNSRVFDALGTGTLVLSDNAAGSDEWFDGLLPTYSDRGELRSLLDIYLHDPAARSDLADRLRTLVHDRHTYARRAAEFTAAIEQTITRPEIAFRIGPPGWDVADQWGDTHFARDMAQALRRLGWRTRLDVVPDWDSPAAQAADVVLHLRGMTPYAVKPGAVNVMWMISHPDDVTPTELDKYDLVLVASETHAREIADLTSTPVRPLLQAANTDRYHPGDPDPDLAAQLVFVGNSRGQQRSMVEWAIAGDLPLSVWGAGWDDLIPPQFVRADRFPNDRLPSLYRSAGVVLSDHWPDMAAKGFISNRIYEAMATGAVVISDHVDGLHALDVPTVGNASELAAAVRHFLDDDDLRARHGKANAHRAAEHSFHARAAELDRTLRPLLEHRVRFDRANPTR